MEPATKRQTWALFCLTKQDYRNKGLSKEQASKLISELSEAQNKTRWTESKVKAVIREARIAGGKAADIMLGKLQEQGPKFAVVNDPEYGGDGKIAGVMLDVCGMATMRILARGKFYLLCKKLSENDKSLRFLCQRGYYGGGRLSIFDMTGRQELSVNETAYRAAAEVLANYGIEATVESRID